jgi:drug/metabolite transporter (DMT)-like permease
VPGSAARRAEIWAALLVVYVVWGSTYLAILLAIRTIPVFLMGTLRFLVAGVLLYAWSSRRGDADGDRPGRREWSAAAILGTLMFLVGNTSVAWAEQRVATGTASLVVATIPLWIALFDRIACGQRLSRQAIAGLALGFGGVALLADPAGAGGVDPAGLVVLLLGSAGWAIGSLYARRAPLPRRPLVGSSMQMIVGGSLLAVVAAASGELADVSRPSAESLLALGYLVGVGSIVAFSCYAWLLRNARTSLVSTYAYVNPLVAVFLGWAIENEGVGVRTVGAGALILVAVALIVSPGRGLRRASGSAVAARAS